MTWFKRHINITWLFAWLIQWPMILLDNPIPYLVAWALFIAITIWALNQKGRNYAWVLIPIAVLVLHNQKEAYKNVAGKN